MWESAALGLGAWQLVLGSVVVWRTPDHVVLGVLHVVVMALAVATLRAPARDLARSTYFVALLGVLSLDLVATSDPLMTTAVCMTFVVSATPFLVLPPLTASAVVGCSLVLAVALSSSAGTGDRTLLAVVVPSLSYSALALLLAVLLRRYTGSVDAEADAADLEHERLVTAQASSRAAAEHLRVLHDTVVNTLAAIASGGRWARQSELVRRRCRQDLLAIASIDPVGPVAKERERSGVEERLSVIWTGVPTGSVADVMDLVAPHQRPALRGILNEALLNVEKHAGTDRVEIAVDLGDELVTVTVADDGRGFTLGGTAGPASRAAGARGLEESVHARAADHGIDVEVESAPGRGTRVRIRCVDSTSSSTPAPVDGSHVPVSADRIRHAGAWGWCAGVATASTASVAIGMGTPAGYASVMVVALLVGGAWLAFRRGRGIPRWLGPVIVAGVPTAFVLGFLGATADESDAAFWQGIGVTPLLVVLLIHAGSPRLLLTACGSLVAAVAVVAASTWNDPGAAASVAIANAALQLAQLNIWLLFVRVLDRISDHALETRRDFLRDRAALAALEAAVTTQRRWRETQVRAALDVLRSIADGRTSAADPTVAQRAAREEHHLRQLLLLRPELVNLGPWLCRALGRGRGRGLSVTLRLGEHDVGDPVVAEALGRALLEVLALVEAGTEVVVAHFGAQAEHDLTVVGPAGFLTAEASVVVGAVAIGCEVSTTRLASQDLVRIRSLGCERPSAE